MANSLEFEHCFAQLACDLGICSPKGVIYGIAQKNNPASQHYKRDIDQILQETGIIDESQCKKLKIEAMGLLSEVPHVEGYELMDLLSVQGFNRVYRAHQLSVDRQVFLKVLNIHGKPESPATKRFTAEAQILARFNHHNICGAIDMGETADCTYLVLQHPDGTLGSECIKNKKFLSRVQLLNLLSSLAHLLQYIHSKEAIHGNISPDNIIIHNDGSCSLTGFNYAICNSIQQTSLPVWPAEFPAPEELTKTQADFYAAAASVWLLAGGKLYHDTTTGGLQGNGFRANRKTFAGLRQILRKMLNPSKRHNYFDAQEILHDLQILESGLPPEIAFTDSKSFLTFKTTKIRRWLKPVACVAGLAIGGAASWMGCTFLTNRQDQATGKEEVAFKLDRSVSSLPRWQQPPLNEEEDKSVAAGKMWMNIVTTEPGKRDNLLKEFIEKYPNAPQSTIARQLQEQDNK